VHEASLPLSAEAGPLTESGPEAAPALEARGLGRRFGRRWALAEVSLRLAPGEALLVAGRNGSGKSTLLRVLATALRPDRGTGAAFGFDLVRERDAVRRHSALLGHQAFTYETLTALENLQVAARFLGRGAGRGDLLPLLEEVGLADRADDVVSTFSAGMRKRLALARVLLQDARLVLLDEPYGTLDPPGFVFVDRLAEAVRQRGATLVMATHLLERGTAHCDQALLLAEGRLAWGGRAADLPRAARAEGLQEC
jgi:heme exporter protein A